ncbi:MAG: hypothetical protein JST82_07310 [Bacteroidetes bacterium]|nr:hypothetical protein [Bacteroidota bacterium]
MKRLLLIPALLISFQTLYAQGLQAGVRTGSGYLNSIDNSMQAEHTVWNKGIYARYETKNGWAFELNSSHYSYTYEHGPWVSYCAPWQEPNISGRLYTDDKIRAKEDVFELNISAQRAITNAHRKNPRFSDYFGYSLGILRTYSKETTYYHFDDDPNTTNNRSGYGHSMDPQISLSNTLYVNLSKHIVFSNTMAIQSIPFINSFGAFDVLHSSKVRFIIAFGVGYRF